eukprot:TRINITY_DN222_c0_g1_i6.p1 TRINITY_DN222_c0_g1~~TRINITY_DN222_c0_g1_i6.p1  ORF type:complete len:303 (+),score=12.59 TRINITY_DN222_c0_g1_i6:294-1202(+)
MALNVPKTNSFCTDPDTVHCIRSPCGAKLQRVSELKILGPLVNIDGESKLNWKVVAATSRALRRLSLLPLDFERKASLIATTIYPSYLHGAEYCPASLGQLNRLATDVTDSLWGSQKMRSVNAVLAFMLKGHAVHPMGWTIYRTLNTLTRIWNKSTTLFDRATRLANIYMSTDVDEPRVVGTLRLTWMKRLGISWDRIQSLVQMEPPQRKHEIREDIRRMISSKTCRDRPSFEGAESGADPMTNALWQKSAQSAPFFARAVKRVICGCVYNTHPCMKALRMIDAIPAVSVSLQSVPSASSDW